MTQRNYRSLHIIFLTFVNYLLLLIHTSRFLVTLTVVLYPLVSLTSALSPKLSEQFEVLLIDDSRQYGDTTFIDPFIEVFDLRGSDGRYES